MIKPLALLEEVRILSKGSMSPARRRTVISRAYYAAYSFLHFSPIAATFNRDPNARGGVHRQFIEFLIESGDLNTKFAGRKLEGLYARRITADYFYGVEVTNNMATESVEDAEEIIEEIFAEEEWPQNVASLP